MLKVTERDLRPGGFEKNWERRMSFKEKKRENVGLALTGKGGKNGNGEKRVIRKGR